MMDGNDQAVVRHLARLMYLAYCRKRGESPFREGYVPAWALDYAEVAVDFLGYEDDVLSRDVVPA